MDGRACTQTTNREIGRPGIAESNRVKEAVETNDISLTHILKEFSL